MDSGMGRAVVNLGLVICLAIALCVICDSQRTPSAEDVGLSEGTTTAFTEMAWEGISTSVSEDPESPTTLSPVSRSSSHVEAPGESAWSWQMITWSWWLILQMMAAVLGIVGNLVVIAVLFQRRAQSRSTDTLIGALAAADLLTSVFMAPLPFPRQVPPTVLGEGYCKVVFTSMLLWVAIDASIFTLTIIPVERYLAIVYPLHFRRLMSRRVVTACIVMTWVAAFATNFFLFFVSGVDRASSRCQVVFPSHTAQLATGVILYFVQLVIPALVMLILQGLTARALHVQSRSLIGASTNLDRANPASRHLLAKQRVLQMLFLVIMVFTVCWGIPNTAYLAYNLGILPDSYLYSPTYRVLVVLAFCNSCANPIIYTARYPQFRAALKEMFTFAKRTNAPLFEEK